MRRFVAMLVTALLVSGCLSGLTASAEEATAIGPEQAGAPAISLEGKEVVEIREKMFLTQFNDIFMNPDDYIGKVIRYQGIYSEEPYDYEGKQMLYRCVYRKSPGCCGADGQVGLEIVWDQEPPKNKDWVEVTGILEYNEVNGVQYMQIRAATLTTLAERGLEFVSQ